MMRWATAYYRELITLGFLLFLYPQLTDRKNLIPDSPGFAWFHLLWIGMGLIGIAGNILKLRSLDPAIRDRRLLRQVTATPTRFLAGFIALPLMLFLPVFILVGEKNAETGLAVGFLLLGLVIWVLLLQSGSGRRREQPARRTVLLGNGLLILFELFLYTLFLESIWLAEEDFHITLFALVTLVLPMTGLFFLLFLPATIGFYIEECVRSGSWKVAAARQWFKFAVFRYLPTYTLFYMESHGYRFPWAS